MKRFVIAALAMGAVSTAAMAAGTYGVTTTEPAVRTSTTVITDDDGMASSTAVIGTFDTTLGERFEIERAIVDRAAQVFGRAATFSSGRNLAPSIENSIVEGDMMPSGAPVRAVPSALGDLPTSQGGEWIATGEHLVEVAPDGRIAMVVYDVLP